MEKPEDFKIKTDEDTEFSSMVTPKSYDEFKDTGLLFLINSVLHAFGWAIVAVRNSKKETTAFIPARVKYRGFPESIIDSGYSKIATYMKDNAVELEKEVNEKQ